MSANAVNRSIDGIFFHRLKKSLALVVCLFLVGLLWSPVANALEVQPSLSSQPIQSGVHALVTPRSYSISKVMEQPQSIWKQLHEGINAGYVTSVHWYRFQLHNTTTNSLQRLLEIGYSQLDHVQLYVTDNNTVLASWTTGDSLPFDARPIISDNFVFPLTLPANTARTVYLRVQTAGALQVPLTLWQERAYYQASERALEIRAIFYGILLVMVLYNLSLFFAMGERVYFMLGLTTLSILLFLMTLHGFSFRYFYPQVPALNGPAMLLIIPITEICFCLFAMEFLQLRKNSLAWYRLFQFFLVLSIAGLLGAAALSYHLSNTLSVYLALIIDLVCIAAGIRFWFQRSEGSRIFAIAWIVLLIGVAFTALNKMGVVPTTFVTRHGFMLGATLQVLMLSFALASRVTREKNARLVAQQASYDALTQQYNTEKRLLSVLSHDRVSGLPSRVLFEKSLERHFTERTDENGITAVVLLHVRHLDDFNKTLGYKRADDYIRLVAERLDQFAANSALVLPVGQKAGARHYVAHMEGVSFALAMWGDSEASLRQEIKGLIARATRPVDFRGLYLDLNFLVGCSFDTGGDSNPLALLREAAIALGQQRLQYNDVTVYQPEMDSYNPRRLTLMTELREALEKDQLMLYYQPQVRLADKTVGGFEALLRWHHPKYGTIPPDEFIPLAEQTRLIQPLTDWVIRQALTFCQDLDKTGCDASVAVNISANNLSDPTFSERLRQLLEASGVAPTRLMLEVTETAAMANPADAIAVLHRLREVGVRLSIDDFGTGYSSLSYIRQMPVQEIKIDNAFVREMDSNEGDATIVRTTIEMCHSLGFEVVAEGVENADVCRLLSGMQCNLAQGYHILHPGTREDVLAWIARADWEKSCG